MSIIFMIIVIDIYIPNAYVFFFMAHRTGSLLIWELFTLLIDIQKMKEY